MMVFHAMVRALVSCTSLAQCAYVYRPASVLAVPHRLGCGEQVIGAKIQQITMNEFLPALGISHMDVRKEPTRSFGPEITVEFATAAYRLGHGAINSAVP